MTDNISLTEHDDAAPQSPPGRNPKLQALEALVGDWLLGDPSAAVGRTSFSWLQGGFFLVQRWTVNIPEVPDGIAILGEDATTGGLIQHYYDSRGIARVYEMSLEDDVWKLWRNGPDFWQRFTGKLSQDGTAISGAWESSPDGLSWQHDFDLLYTKVS